MTNNGAVSTSCNNVGEATACNYFQIHLEETDLKCFFFFFQNNTRNELSMLDIATIVVCEGPFKSRRKRFINGILTKSDFLKKKQF